MKIVEIDDDGVLVTNLKKENEADRFNENKIEFSFINFNIFSDMYKNFPLISNIVTTEDCLVDMINTLSVITNSKNRDVYEAFIPVLQGLGYKLALLEKGLKFYDSCLYDLRAFEEMAKVLTYGAKKYDRDNWKKGYVNKFSSADSLYRHIRQVIIGEKLDDESGISHIGHIMSNIMILTNDLLILR